MFDQCMGDCYNNQNYYCGSPAIGQWWYDNSYYGPWYTHYPFDNWNWYCSFNNYGEGHRADFHCPNKSPKCNINHENKRYERHLSEHYANLESAEPLRKSLKIDCFATETGARKTQSELLKGSSRCSLKKSTPRRRNCNRSRKSKLSATSQSTTTFENLLGKLGMQICSNGGTLAYILLESDASKKDEQSCGDNANVKPSRSYSTQPTHELKSGSLRFGVKRTTVHSSAEKCERKMAQPSQHSTTKVKGEKSDKIIRKKESVHRKEATIGNRAVNKENRCSTEPLINKGSRLKKPKQYGKQAKLNKEKEENLGTSAFETPRKMKIENLSSKTEYKSISNTRKPSEQKCSTLASRKNMTQASSSPPKRWRI
ncbi:PREDICTED: uncharacterized protein LOC108369523 [Rhagoletis zephyria]|uniref:uncharacterized protein LOC108369523 n=1 Tax=Rhagoletis zephyria TaxID=28612 RepID=UPI0008119E99|nr:PREDICTED: uncharacterized protein LOC108369523 [Rhagoletis zephyria]